MKKIVELLLEDSLGIYLPQQFAKSFNPENSYWVYSLEDAEILREGPDNEFYDDVWMDVLDNAYYQEPGKSKYFLYQNSDLFAVKEGFSYNENDELINDETNEKIEF